MRVEGERGSRDEGSEEGERRRDRGNNSRERAKGEERMGGRRRPGVGTGLCGEQTANGFGECARADAGGPGQGRRIRKTAQTKREGWAWIYA